MGLSRMLTENILLCPKYVVCSNSGMANSEWKRCRAGVAAVTQCLLLGVEQAVRERFFVIVLGCYFSDSLRLANEDRNMSYICECHVV